MGASHSGSEFCCGFWYIVQSHDSVKILSQGNREIKPESVSDSYKFAPRKLKG